MRAHLPLYEAGSVRSHVRQAKNIELQRQYEIMNVRKAVKDDIARNWKALSAARQEVEEGGLQAILAQKARDGIDAQAKLGERTITDVLDADEELSTVQATTVRAQRNADVSAFNLAASLGALTPERLNMKDAAYDPAPHHEAVKHKIFSMNTD